MELKNTKKEQPVNQQDVLGLTDKGELVICKYDPSHGAEWWLKIIEESFEDQADFIYQNIEDFNMCVEKWSYIPIIPIKKAG